MPVPITNVERFIAESKTLLDHCLVLISKKNHDYSDTMDVFSNFKSSAEVAGITPVQAVLTLLGMKMARLTQLIGNGKKPVNETTDDTIADLINYALILRGVIQEENPNSVTK